jgi:hypothetical protein
MQSLAIPNATASKLERRIQLRQSAGPLLRICFLSFDNPTQLARQHCANTSALLCREGPHPFQKALVDCQRDVLLHRLHPISSLHVKYVKDRILSNVPEHIERARTEFFVGNLYVKRKCTGAMVGAHPFGGFNMSGTDSKGGGPDYLLLFLQAKSIAERVG